MRERAGRSRVRRFGRMDCARPDPFPLRCIPVPDTVVTRGILLRLCRPSSVLSFHASAIPELLCPQPYTCISVASHVRGGRAFVFGPGRCRSSSFFWPWGPCHCRPAKCRLSKWEKEGTPRVQHYSGAMCSCVCRWSYLGAACPAVRLQFRLQRSGSGMQSMQGTRRPGIRQGGLGRRPVLGCSCPTWVVGMAWGSSS